MASGATVKSTGTPKGAPTTVQGYGVGIDGICRAATFSSSSPVQGSFFGCEIGSSNCVPLPQKQPESSSTIFSM